MYLSIISLHTSARRGYRCPALIDYLFEQGTLCSHCLGKGEQWTVHFYIVIIC